MRSKNIYIVSAIAFLLVLVAVGISYAERVDDILGTTVVQGNLHINGDVRSVAGDYKYEYMPIGYVGATQCRVGGIGDDLVCAGLSAGADETGAATGYVIVDDAADFLRFRFPMPETFYDGGLAGDFELALDLSSSVTATPSSDIQVRVFEKNNITPIFDGLEATGTVDLGYVMNTLTMSGTNTSLDKDDILTVEVTAIGDTDDFAIRGARLKYRPGIDTD